MTTSMSTIELWGRELVLPSFLTHNFSVFTHFDRWYIDRVFEGILHQGIKPNSQNGAAILTLGTSFIDPLIATAFVSGNHLDMIAPLDQDMDYICELVGYEYNGSTTPELWWKFITAIRDIVDGQCSVTFEQACQIARPMAWNLFLAPYRRYPLVFAPCFMEAMFPNEETCIHAWWHMIHKLLAPNGILVISVLESAAFPFSNGSTAPIGYFTTEKLEKIFRRMPGVVQASVHEYNGAPLRDLHNGRATLVIVKRDGLALSQLPDLWS